MAQYGHRAVTNKSDHAIAGIEPGETVQGGGMGSTHMAVTISTMERVNGDGQPVIGHTMSAQVLAGANNLDKDGNTLNKVPNVSAPANGKPAQASSNELLTTKVMAPGKDAPDYNTSIQIGPSQAEAFTKAMEAARGDQGPNYSQSGEKDGTKFSRATYIVQAELQSATGKNEGKDGTTYQSQGAMPKVDTIKASPAVVPDTEEAFRNEQKRAREELKAELENGSLDVARVDKQKDASKNRDSKPLASERHDVIVRLDLNPDGTIPQSQPDAQGFSYTHGQMLVAEKDGKLSYAAPSQRDDNGRPRRDDYFNAGTVKALLDKGSVAEISYKQGDQEKRSLVITANADVTEPNRNGRRKINLEGGIQPSESMPEATADTWKDAKDKMAADFKAQQMQAPKGYQFAAPAQAAPKEAAPAPVGRDAGKLAGVAADVEAGTPEKTGDYGDE